MGFGHFLEILPFEIHLGLLISFAERFNSNFGSFILRVGEMMITLEDVVRLVGLRVDGEPVVAVWQPCYGDELEACYGVRPPRSGRCHTRVNVKWLKDRLDALLLVDEVTLDVADQQLPVFLSIMFHRLFFGMSSQMLHASSIPLLLDVERIGTYSWGSTVLVYLISRLEAFAAGHTRSLSGCLPFF